jgi:uncharacterized coiled-coil protein SlyX
MVNKCGEITWFILNDGRCEFWMSTDKQMMSLDELISKLEELCGQSAGNSHDNPS